MRSFLIAALALSVGGSALFAGDPPAPAPLAPAPAAATTLKLSDLPAAVKKTYEEKAEGAEPISIEKVVKEGKAVYVIKYHGKKDKEKVIKIGEDGKLLKKHDDKKDEKHDEKK